MDAISSIAIAAGLSWASGIRLYAVVCIVGLLGRYGYVDLPEGLQILTHPVIIGISAILLLLEFFADKIPGIDSLWDALNTFVRIPAGALLAVGAIDSHDPLVTTAIALLGAALAGSTHFAKAGSRSLINTSPEPFSNLAASFSEEGLVAIGVWAAFTHPLIFLAGLALFILLLIWLLPRVWRGLRFVFGKLEPSNPSV